MTPAALQRCSKTTRNTRTKAQSATHLNTNIQGDHHEYDRFSDFVLQFVFHRIAEGELSKIQQM